MRSKVILVSLFFALSTWVYAASCSQDLEKRNSQLEALTTELFTFYKAELKARKFGDPDIRFYWESIEGVVDADEPSATTNPLEGFEENGLRQFYTVIFNRAIFDDLTLLPALTIVTHELGHLIGQGPYESNSAGEGESDYQSGTLLLRFLKAKHPELLSLVVDALIEKRIAAYAPELSAEGVRIAAAAFIAQSKTATTPIVIEKPDPTVVQKTLVIDYPSKQARFDSVLAGLRGQPRPRSWKAD